MNRELLEQRTKRILNLVDLTGRKIRVKYINDEVYFNYEDIAREIGLSIDDSLIKGYKWKFCVGDYISECYLFGLLLMPLCDKYAEFINMLAFGLLPSIVTSGNYVRIDKKSDLDILYNSGIKVEA